MARAVDILILTSDLDFATDRVCDRLAASGGRFLRLNREQLPDLEITFDPAGCQLFCRREGDAWQVNGSLRCVWWRLGTFDRTVAGPSAGLDVQLIRSQWGAFMRSMMVFNEARWINHPAATYRAETKAVQLRAARLVGLTVPETLMTNDPGAPVVALMGNRIAFKSIDTLLLRDGTEQIFGYTSMLDWDDVSDVDLRAAPATIQHALDPKLDLRLTIVGGQAWCVEIRRRGEGIPGDWRLTAKVDLEYIDHPLPSNVLAQCHALMDELGLVFGAIDLILAEGRYWFIEINPTGEWGWLDGPDRPIASGIADELLC